ncbi:MAG: transcription antitermination factor NusB [Acidobacteria bacterium]|nr:transcription antitermination factor NusB [Acidobacteriota bacterium]
MLFQWEVGKHPPAYVLQTFLGQRRLAPDVDAFARALFGGTVEEASALDHLIAEHAQHWRVERMAAIDRNILRMALYEILHQPETPAAVVINEALEIARRFSGEESVEFINGVLDAIRKSLPQTGPPP